MKGKWISVAVLLMMLLILLVMPVAAVSTTVVIGEVQTRGSAGASDEFVEIYNLSLSTLALGNYRLQYQSCSGTTSTTYFTFPTGTNLQAYGHFLIGGSAYDGGTSTNGTLSSGISDCGKLQLQNASGTVVDTLAYGFGTTLPSGGWAGLEGTSFGSNPHDNTTGTNQDTSMARKPDTLSAAGGHTNGSDTDDNSSDFLATVASSPENMASPLAVTLRTLTARAPLNPLAAVSVAGLALAGGLVAWRRRA